nr:immunoglobulin light chain junction region [Macaca mulatta]
CMQGLECPFTF